MWRWLSLATVFGFAWLSATFGDEQVAKTPILLDCAVGNGIDDALALALATTDPTIELLGVTTVSGNTEDRAWIVCRFLSAIGKDKIPVAFGRGEQPPADIKGQFQYRYHPAVLYGRTAKPVKQTAVELLHERLTASETKTTIVCTGPLTNIAQLLAEYPGAKEHVERIIASGGPGNLASDVASAKAVFASGLSIDVLPLEWAVSVRLDSWGRERIFGRYTPLTWQLQTLYELDKGPDWHPDVAAVALASTDSGLKQAYALAPATITLNDDGRLKWAEGESPVRIVKSLKRELVLDWMQKQLTHGDPVLPRELANRTKPIDRGGMPNRVHVCEDYETDIERRWWLAGVPAGNSDVRGSSRHLRGMLTMDFDDQQRDTKTMYRAVIFNPVPGPPMGEHPRLFFRCRLKGTDQLRVQIYSLTNGYHRYLSLPELPQDKWLDLAVDMTAARRHDGSGGPLSENERIDDIQFYVDPRAELLIDDIVLFDAAPAEEERLFPKRMHFSGWFDTGKQGQQWPGTFEIPADSGYFWKAARSIHRPAFKQSVIVVNLRGRRPLGSTAQLDFRYQTASAAPLEIIVRDSQTGIERTGSLAKLATGDWQPASISLGLGKDAAKQSPAGQDTSFADELHFVRDGADEFWIDDLLLYEPGEE